MGTVSTNRSASHEIAANAISAVPSALAVYSSPRSNGCGARQHDRARAARRPHPRSGSPARTAGTRPSTRAGRHQSVRSSRPSTIPAQKKASHGNSGWVPLTKTSKSSARGEPPAG